MSAFASVILAVQMLTALGMIGLVLMQHGKGADMGAAFGSGTSGSLFGASGSANFLSRTTGVLAAVFFACTLALAYLGNAGPASSGSVLESVPAAAAIPAPIEVDRTIPVAPTPEAAAPAPEAVAPVPEAAAPAAEPAVEQAPAK